MNVLGTIPVCSKSRWLPKAVPVVDSRLPPHPSSGLRALHTQ